MYSYTLQQAKLNTYLIYHSKLILWGTISDDNQKSAISMRYKMRPPDVSPVVLRFDYEAHNAPAYQNQEGSKDSVIKNWGQISHLLTLLPLYKLRGKIAEWMHTFGV